MRLKLYKQRHAIWQQGINISFLLPFFILLTTVIALFVAVMPADAVASSTLNFQGRLLTNTGGLVADGSYNIEFKIYDDEFAGSNLWTETRTGIDTVTVRNGYFSVYLGDVTPFGASIPWDQELYMTMNVNSDGEMTPRFKLTAVPYAFRAGAVTDAAGNAFTGDDLIQKAPSTVQAVNSALAAISLNQAGAGGLLQLQGDGSDVFTVDKTGATILGAGITVGNSTNTTAGTIRWSGTDLEVYDGSAWTSLTGGGGGGGTLAYDAFYAYDAVGNISLDAGWTDITLDSEVKEDAPYTHAADSAEVTINEDGWYEVTYNVGLYTSDSNNNRGTADAKLQENTGGGFTDIPGSEGTAYLRGNGGEGNVSVTMLRQFTTGDIIKIQAQRSLGSNASLTLPNSAGLTIKKFIDASGLGGSGTSFEQNGNDFGGTAILGTTSVDGLTIITNNTAALTFNSGGDATFANALTISGGLDLTGDITSTTGLKIASGGGNDLELESSSGTIILSAGTLQRSAAGTTTIDLFDNGAGTTLSLLNSSGTQVAGLNVEGDVTAQNFSGAGAGLTGLDGSNISIGTIADGRLSGNVVLLDQNQTFSGTPTFGSGLILGTSTSTTSGAVRWSGSDFEGYDGIQWVSLTSGGGGGGGGPLSVSSIQAFDNSGGTDLNTVTPLAVPWDSETKKDTGFTHSNVTNNTRITFDDIGWYRVSYSVSATTGGTRSNVFCEVRLNGTTPISTTSSYSYGRLASDPNITNTASAYIETTAINEYYEVLCSGVGSAGTAIAIAGESWTIAELAVTPSGGGGLSFEQNGNDFGGAAILGTTGSDNLNFITNNSTALSLTTTNQAVFSGEILANGGTTLGDSAGDGLTIVSDSVTVSNGLNFDSDTLVIDSANNRVGIGTSLTTNLLTINDANTADAVAQLLLATGANSNKGLVIQGDSVQSANLFEVQDSSGNTLAGFDANGGLVLGLSTVTSNATVSRNIALPDASGIVCLSSSASCGFLPLATGTFVTDATTNNTIAINKTGATGNLLALQKNGGAVFTVSNTGALQIQNSSSAALDIRNTGGTSYFSVDTTTGIVRVGPSTADANGVLFVLDTKNTAGDPTGVNGGQYYNSNLNKFRCFENGVWVDCISRIPQVRSFLDVASTAAEDDDVTPYWVTGANPSITLSDSTNSVYGSVTVEFTSTSTQNRDIVARIEQGIGSAPTCGSGTVVGSNLGIFSTNSGLSKSSTVTFLDNAATTSEVFYTVCSDSGSNAVGGISVTSVSVTLQEVENSN